MLNRTFRGLALSALFAVAVLIDACGGGSGGDPAPNLDGTSWVLTDVAGMPALVDPEATLQFDGPRIAGHASCNGFGAAVKITDDRIRVTELTQTLIGCPEAISEQEARYTKALSEARSFELDDGDLLIHCYGFDQPLRFVSASR